MTAAIVALIVQLDGSPKVARQLAPIVVAAAARYQLDPRLLVAVVRNESRFRVDARGAKGELGLAQVKRNTMATRGYDHLPDGALLRPALNLKLGARHLARCRRICGGMAAPPERYLSVYNGRRYCRPSLYSKRVLARIR